VVSLPIAPAIPLAAIAASHVLAPLAAVAFSAGAVLLSVGYLVGYVKAQSYARTAAL
jgi:hypothetical protein